MVTTSSTTTTATTTTTTATTTVPSTIPESGTSTSMAQGRVNELRDRFEGISLSQMDQRIRDLETTVLNSLQAIHLKLDGRPRRESQRAEDESSMGAHDTLPHYAGERVHRAFQRPLTSLFDYPDTMMVPSTKALINPMDLPRFDGDRSKAAAWIRKYERAANLNFWGPEHLIRGVGRCMVGDAEKWYELEYLPQHRSTHTWEDFRRAFAESYIRPADKMVYYNRILSRKQRPDESLSAYYREILQLCLDYDSNIREDDIIQFVCANMHPRYTPGIVSSLAWLSTLVKENDDMAVSLWSSEGSSAGVREHRRERPSRRDESSDKERREPRTVAAPETVVCYNCKSKGHYSSKCPKEIDLERIKLNSRLLKSSRNLTVGSEEAATSSSEILISAVEINSSWKLVTCIEENASDDDLSAKSEAEVETPRERIRKVKDSRPYLGIPGVLTVDKNDEQQVVSYVDDCEGIDSVLEGMPLLSSPVEDIRSIEADFEMVNDAQMRLLWETSFLDGQLRDSKRRNKALQAFGMGQNMPIKQPLLAHERTERLLDRWKSPDKWSR